MITTVVIQKVDEKSGEDGYWSHCLVVANDALYHLSYIPELRVVLTFFCNKICIFCYFSLIELQCVTNTPHLTWIRMSSIIGETWLTPLIKVHFEFQWHITCLASTSSSFTLFVYFVFSRFFTFVIISLLSLLHLGLISSSSPWLCVCLLLFNPVNQTSKCGKATDYLVNVSRQDTHVVTQTQCKTK